MVIPSEKPSLFTPFKVGSLPPLPRLHFIFLSAIIHCPIVLKNQFIACFSLEYKLHENRGLFWFVALALIKEPSISLTGVSFHFAKEETK